MMKKILMLLGLSLNFHAFAISEAELHNKLEKLGIHDSHLSSLKCIARRESSLRERAIHRNRNGTKDYGLFQINSIWIKKCGTSSKKLLNSENNTKCAKIILINQGLSAWVTLKLCLNSEMKGYKAVYNSF